MADIRHRPLTLPKPGQCGHCSGQEIKCTLCLILGRLAAGWCNTDVTVTQQNIPGLVASLQSLLAVRDVLYPVMPDKQAHCTNIIKNRK